MALWKTFKKKLNKKLLDLNVVIARNPILRFVLMFGGASLAVVGLLYLTGWIGISGDVTQLQSDYDELYQQYEKLSRESIELQSRYKEQQQENKVVIAPSKGSPQDVKGIQDVKDEVYSDEISSVRL